jgi:hypothetical protein
MKTEPYPKAYLYRRIVQAKIFIDNNYADKIHLKKISAEAFFQSFISTASLNPFTAKRLINT